MMNTDINNEKKIQSELAADTLKSEVNNSESQKGNDNKGGKRKLSKKAIVALALLPLMLAVVVAFCIVESKNEFAIPNLMIKEIWREVSPEWEKPGKYWVAHMQTPNIYEDEENEVLGIVLHHTAYPGTAGRVAKALCDPKSKVSCHVVIDKDGTRYVLAPPEATTWHAGFSKWGDRFRANTFMIGIEYHGNTLEEPLTKEQIESSIEYMAPIIKQYGIRAENIVTHEMIRNAYKEAFPKKKNVYSKVDITQEEYVKVLNALDTARLLKGKRNL